jgi:carbon starvation protein
MIVNQYLPTHNYLNTTLSVIMMGLSVIVMADATLKWTAIVREKWGTRLAAQEV